MERAIGLSPFGMRNREAMFDMQNKVAASHMRDAAKYFHNHSARSAPISAMNSARSEKLFGVNASSATAFVTPC